MCRFLAYNTNAYLLRSSISLGEDSEVCGCSMAVALDGSILENMENRVGICVVEFEPKKKYYKSSGFNGTAKAHYCKANPNYQGNAAMLLLMYTGMRVGELETMYREGDYIYCKSEKIRRGRKQVIRKIPLFRRCSNADCR